MQPVRRAQRGKLLKRRSWVSKGTAVERHCMEEGGRGDGGEGVGRREREKKVGTGPYTKAFWTARLRSLESLLKYQYFSDMASAPTTSKWSHQKTRARTIENR